MKEKRIIGRREKITLPEWGLHMISGKIDTGAYTSSIHCEYVQEKTVDGISILEFKVLAPGHIKYKDRLIKTANYTQKKVKNSFGVAEIRYKVNTIVSMFGEEFEAEFTLSDRSKMRNAILIGRKTLKGKFLVDIDQVNLSKNFKNPNT
ncbi:ATP-dependent zinc protease family protein [Anditalea andensis]|uniref:30S ribosomal protein S6 modification protein RimK n=1 Tax=Anditalea andensis TaxID=1048983 RepID=A0A074KWK7_9BACT|nr:RimK/LysX family protein [Anditalea andensis]KEO73329.1 30S ribosomal protein S6 modification protein RimK [Anditalea andensis]